MESKRPKISAFRMATETQAVTAEIGIEEILLVKPSWSRADAVAFLNQHGDAIGKAMASAGASAMVTLLAGGGHHGN